MQTNGRSVGRSTARNTWLAKVAEEKKMRASSAKVSPKSADNKRARERKRDEEEEEEKTPHGFTSSSSSRNSRFKAKRGKEKGKFATVFVCVCVCECSQLTSHCQWWWGEKTVCVSVMSVRKRILERMNQMNWQCTGESLDNYPCTVWMSESGWVRKRERKQEMKKQKGKSQKRFANKLKNCQRQLI